MLSPKEQDARQLWHEVFGDSPEAVARFFSLIYQEEEALVHYTESTASAMLLFPRLNLRAQGGLLLPVGYLCGIATRPGFRGQGLSGALIRQALCAERLRGDLFSCLIPAEPSLYGFYQRQADFFPAFSEEIISDRAAFLSAPTPPPTEGATLESYLQEQEQLELTPALLHSPAWWQAALEDYQLSPGYQILTHSSPEGKIDGALFSMPAGERELWVRAAFGTPAVRAKLLVQLEQQYPTALFRYYLPPKEASLSRPKGMARLLNLGGLLRLYAALRPEARLALPYRDRLFPEEEGLYIVEEGEVHQQPLPSATEALPPSEILRLLGLEPLLWRAYLLTEGEL